MLVLQEHQTCPYSSQCKYNELDSCQGANAMRENVFKCEYVVDGQIIEHGSMRNNYDQTGNMQIIME